MTAPGAWAPCEACGGLGAVPAAARRCPDPEPYRMVYLADVEPGMVINPTGRPAQPRWATILHVREFGHIRSLIYDHVDGGGQGSLVGNEFDAVPMKVTP